tara:strand:- start:7098 stop:7673 length:576 start_codon:yes stop_codon:yes gene_type:complete
MRKMSQLANSDFEPDVLGAAIPGQSLTSNPGQFPYEKPPMTSNPVDAADALVETMLQPHAQKAIAQLLDIGASAEMIASSYVLGGVAEGLFDVDVAEIIKPALILHIVGIADDLALEDINVLDSAPPQGPSDGEHLETMSKVSPERFKKKYIDSMSDNNTEDEMMPEEEDMMMENELPMLEGFISRPMEEV